VRFGDNEVTPEKQKIAEALNISPERILKVMKINYLQKSVFYINQGCVNKIKVV